MNSVREDQELFKEMREHAYWKNRRNDLVLEGFKRGMSVHKIAEEMDLNPATVRGIKKRNP